MHALFWAQFVLHALVSLAWFLLPMIWPQKVVWFQGASLVATHMATGVLALFRVLHDARRAARTLAAIFDFVGLVPVGLYMANLILARGLTSLDADPDTLSLAHLLWQREEALAITVLVLLAATALVHLFVVVSTLVIACRVSAKEEHDAALQLNHQHQRL